MSRKHDAGVSPQEPPFSSAGSGCEPIKIDRRTSHSTLCRWTIRNFPTLSKTKVLYSPYFEVGGFDCRFVLYPKGDSLSLTGSLSLYIQLIHPSTYKFNCFAHYKLSILNHFDKSQSICRDSVYRFTPKKKSFGWIEFAISSTVLDPKVGFVFDESLVILADICVLDESSSFVPDIKYGSNGKFTWNINNLGNFKEILRTHKLTSPNFTVEKCNLRVVAYQTKINGVEYLSIGVDGKDNEKLASFEDRSCWCMFKVSVLNRKSGCDSIHRDKYGRVEGRMGGNFGDKLIGWSDYMEMSRFIGLDNGFVVDDTVVICVSFHAMQESSNSMMLSGCLSGKNCVGENKSDRYSGKFMWTIKNFTRLKDVLKKRKITGVDAKSPRFQIGNQDLRLVVYPRGQSHPPSHLSLFLEVTDSNNDSPDWSCFLSYHLSVVNKKLDKVFEKHSQTRCSKDRRELGWSEFMTLNQLFDKESGFLSEDEVTLSADVSVLKETFVEANSSTMGFLGLEMGLDEKKEIFMWKMENFLSFKEISDTQKVVSRIFLVGGCKLQMGVSVTSNRLCASLECNPLVVGGPDKSFLVSYRIRVVNHKNPAKSLWGNSSFCTKTSNNSVIEFMSVPEMAESTSRCGREAVIFICEILDCCPCPDCTEQEVLASQCPNEVAHSNASQVSSGDVEDIIRNFLARAKLYLIMCRDNCFQPQVTDNILNTSDWICGILNKVCNYLDESVEVEYLHHAMKRFGCSAWKQDSEKTNEFLPTPLNVWAKVRLLQLETIHFLLNIMVECCHHLEGRSTENFSEASSKPSADNSGVISQLIFHEQNGATDSAQSLKYDVHGAKDNSFYAVQCSDAIINDASREAFHGETPFKTPAKVLAELGSIQVPKRLEQSEELLVLIINSLKSLDDTVPQEFIEPKHRPPLVQKIPEILDKSPKHIKKDLVSLLPKLVDRSEHPLAASALLDQLRKPDTDPVLQLPVFSAMSQLDFCSELWDQVFAHSSKLLVESHNEQLADTIGFLFKAASRCQHIPQAARILRVRLRKLGVDVFPCVLDSLSKALNIWLDLAKVMLRDIDCVSELVDKYLEGLSGPLLFDEDEHVTGNFNMVDDQLLHKELHFWDIYILIELISIPSLTSEASEVFERAVTRGFILESSVGQILERRHAQRLYVASITFADKKEHGCVSGDENIRSSPSQEIEFNSVLGLTERLSLSVDSRVHHFVTRLYVLLFKVFASESYYKRILQGLVHRATSHSNDLQEVVLEYDILVCLVKEELGLSGLILDMMRDVAKVANADHESILHQLRVSEANHLNRQKEREAELFNMAREKASLLKRLTESEAATKHLKAELILEMDRFASEKKDLSKRTQEVETQLKWLQSEQNDEITKLATKIEVYKDRLHNAEVQLSQLRSQNSDDLERVLKEKKALAKKLKSTEAMMIRVDEKLKRCAGEIMIQKDIRQSLEDEVFQLKERVGQIEAEKREKEEQIMQSKAHIGGMEAKLTACQQHIHALEVSLQEEMSQHAPLYGVGLADLSIKELETVSCIHEEGLRDIDAIKQQKLSLGVISPVSSHTFSESCIPYPTVSAPVSISLNKRNLNYKTGDVHGTITAPWYDQT